jgi:phage terminase large subunit-like protein
MPSIVLDRVPMLRPDQAIIARHPAKRKAVCMGRRWGKTVLGLVLVLSALLQGLRVAWLVPTYRNSNPLWRAVESALAPLRKAGRAKLNRSERYVELWNGGFLGVYTADNPDAMRGEWFDLVVTDEASRVPEAVIEEVVEPTLADADGDHVAISTPFGKNWFYRLWQRGREDGEYTAAFRAPSSANPMPTIRKAYDRARMIFGEDSNTFRQEWDAEFVDSGAVVWLREWVTRYSLDDDDMDRRVIARMLSYDTANKDKNTNAYSACAVIELLSDYRARLRHVWRERLLMPKLVARVQGDETTTGDIVRWNHDGKLQAVVIEDHASGTGLYQTMMDAGSPALQNMLVAFRPTGSKDERFGQAGVWVKNGAFLVPSPSDQTRWLHTWESEIFEEDEFKDQRDATAQGILYWEHLLAEGHRARMGHAA